MSDNPLLPRPAALAAKRASVERTPQPYADFADTSRVLTGAFSGGTVGASCVDAAWVRGRTIASFLGRGSSFAVGAPAPQVATTLPAELSPLGPCYRGSSSADVTEPVHCSLPKE